MSTALRAALAVLLLAVLLWWHAVVLAPFALSLSLAYVLQPGMELSLIHI